MEETPTSQLASLTPDENECEQHFIKTHTRNQQGKYIVRLPLKMDASLLGNSLGRAQACVRGIINKLKRDDNYKQLYMDFMKEYAQLGHMVPVPAEELYSTPAYYLPHQLYCIKLY